MRPISEDEIIGASKPIAYAVDGKVLKICMESIFNVGHMHTHSMTIVCDSTASRWGTSCCVLLIVVLTDPMDDHDDVLLCVVDCGAH